jgi:hypothetical protein
VLLILTLLEQLPFDQIARGTGHPSSDTIPAADAVLSLLMLKLVEEETRSSPALVANF